MVVVPDELLELAPAGGVFCDFDGVLAPIVDDPDEAVPQPEAAAALASLLGRWARVGVISGRPVAFLQAHLVDVRIDLYGLYGLEYRRGGRLDHHPNAGAWRETVADVGELARGKLGPDVTVEDKAVSLTLHYRGHPEHEAAVTAFAEAQAKRSGLVARAAKMSVELHPPIAVDKGTVIRAEGEYLDAVVYIGDDIGDLTAFDALDVLAAEGRVVHRVAVGSAEAPGELVERADLVLADPGEVPSLLAALGAQPT